MEEAREKHYAFFQNKECEYFPCHDGISEKDFNCLFCYCPLYMLGTECGGDFCYSDNGVKNCKNCIRPHVADNYGEITGQFFKIREKLQETDFVYRNQKKLRYGITTGTCAAAAAKAAGIHLLMGMESETIRLETPKGKRLSIPVHMVEREEHFVEYMVRKDSGDDPDITNRTEIHVRIERLKPGQKENSCSFVWRDEETIYLTGGIGVGIVTREGLEQKVGMPAINKIPRDMIFREVHEVCRMTEYKETLLITVLVPEGENLAKHTFNSRLGIEGGISILGTSGIIEPMSERAIVDTIEVEIKQRAKTGCKNLLITPGNYGQAYASDYLKLDLSDSVKSSNYIGETIDLAISYGMESVFVVGNIGKLIKLAAGIMNTHSKVADGRAEIMAIHTILCGGSREQADCLMSCMNTDQMLGYLSEWKLKDDVIRSICKKIQEHLECRIQGKMLFGVVLFSETYGFLGGTDNVDELLERYKGRE